MLYIGIDSHANKFVCCMINDNKPKDQLFETFHSLTDMCRYFKSLKAKKHFCYEASTACGHIYDSLRPFGEVTVANPKKLSQIYKSKKKNDRNDAKELAVSLMLDRVPEVYIPSQNIRGWRNMIKARYNIVRAQTAVKNRIRALLRAVGIEAPKKPGLWSEKGIAWLKSLQLSQEYELQLNLYIADFQHQSTTRKCLEKELNERQKHDPRVTLLRTIPGIGPRTAEALVASIDDVRRFRRPKHLASYFGLVPVQNQSGESNRLGHVSKEGSKVVRGYLVEAIWRGKRVSPTIAAYCDNIRRQDRKRSKIAVVATAQYIVRVIHAMLRTGEVWQENEAVQKRCREKLERREKRKAKQLAK